ncbi:MAG: GNAT family N-acetyltransferase [Sphingomonadales bacterium]|nr:GNAT family N-acetyltransferase [Sphingomonadales bacterium]
MSPTFRLATSDDLPAMLALYRHLSPEDPLLEPEQVRADYARLIGSDLASLLVADVGGAVVASCLLLIVPNLTRGGRPFAIIENVVTHSDHRRQGLGTRLLALASKRAQAANCYKLMLATGRSDEGVLRFYEQAGFTRGGKTFFEMRWVD